MIKRGKNQTVRSQAIDASHSQPERGKYRGKIARLNSSCHSLESSIQGRRERNTFSISLGPRRCLSRFISRLTFPIPFFQRQVISHRLFPFAISHTFPFAISHTNCVVASSWLLILTLSDCYAAFRGNVTYLRISLAVTGYFSKEEIEG